jgi:hypothetical protein
MPNDTKAGRLREAVYALVMGPLHALAGALPTSIRFLFYELVQQGVLTKKAPGERGRLPSQDLSEALMALRESGLIPWDWIVDETRDLDLWQSAPTVYAYVLEAAKTARIDCWAGEPAPLILTESRSLAGVLRNIASAYLCPIAATNGQVGGFLHTDIIPVLTTGQRVLYFGDEDLSGHQIEHNTRRVIEAETGALRWERLALTPEQVRDYGIPPIEKVDNRYRGGKLTVAYETEALSQIVIQQLLTDRLDALLPEPLEDVRVREDAERADLAERLA